MSPYTQHFTGSQANGARHELPRRLRGLIAWRLAEHAARIRAPLPYEQLERWIRLQWPAVLPEAVGKSLCDLAQTGFLEGDELGWQIRPEYARARAARQHWNGWNPGTERAA